MRQHSSRVGTGKLMRETATTRMRSAEDELVTHMEKMTVLPKVTAFWSVVLLADLWVIAPHELKALLVRPGGDDAGHSSNHFVSKRTILTFLTSRVGFRALCLRFRARPAQNCPKLPETAKNSPKLPKINFSKIYC